MARIHTVACTRMFAVVCFWSVCGFVRCAKDDVKITPDEFMSKYGFFEPGTAPGEVAHSEETRSYAIRKFQEFNHLTVTGTMTDETFDKMQQSRCGLPDFFYNETDSQPLRLAVRRQPLAFSAPGHKWNKNLVTYKFVGYSRKLSQGYQRRAISVALSKWSAVTPLTFREVGSNDADILVNFVRGDHSDGSPFDGNGGTLAHAFFPGSIPISGDTHFDEDETWTQQGPEGTNLEIVAAHEFGHALGLGHSSVEGALMQPFYKYDPRYSLHRDDIQGIQRLYGSGPPPRPTQPTRRTYPTRPTYPTRRTWRPWPTRPTRPTRRPRTTRPPNRRTTAKPSGEDICDLKFDDISNGPNNAVYIFRQKQIYKLNANGQGIERGYPKRTRKVFPRAPNGVGAVVYDFRARKLYMFKGRKYWRYSGFTLDQGYPKRLRGFFVNVDAATLSRANEILLLKGSKVSVWREDFTDAPRGYPVDIGRIWNGLRSDLEAAIRFRNVPFFFKGGNYFRYDEAARKVAYRRAKAGPWLGCGAPNQPK